MTREEASVQIEGLKKYCEDMADSDESGAYVFDLDVQALDLAISALRPVSREQVEQIKGVWIFYDDLWEFRCSKCHKGIGNIEKYKFCPHCGAPMTDEAVQMVMERLEALKDADN